jgi:hypothetical protein
VPAELWFEVMIDRTSQQVYAWQGSATKWTV